MERKPNEIVRRKPGSCFTGSAEPGIVRLSGPEDGDLHDDPEPCMTCGNPDCREWDNSQIVTGEHAGAWMYHLAECQMEDLTHADAQTVAATLRAKLAAAESETARLRGELAEALEKRRVWGVEAVSVTVPLVGGPLHGQVHAFREFLRTVEFPKLEDFPAYAPDEPYGVLSVGSDRYHAYAFSAPDGTRYDYYRYAGLDEAKATSALLALLWYNYVHTARAALEAPDA